MEEGNQCDGNTADSLRKGFQKLFFSEMDTELRLDLEEKKAESPWIEEEACAELQMQKHWGKLQRQQVV